MENNDFEKLQKRYMELYDEDLSYVTGGVGIPLVVLDGVRMETMEGINPKDINSIEVLKDAASAAIYGARAAESVILVCTENKER